MNPKQHAKRNTVLRVIAFLLIVALVYGALALLGLLEPVTGIALPLNRFTAFCASVLGLPGVTALLILRLLL